MAIDKFEVGRTYSWGSRNCERDYFVVSAVSEDTLYYRYPNWESGSAHVHKTPLRGINLSGVLLVTEEKEEPVEEDAVNHPSHYNSDPSGVECIEITRHRNFNIGAAFKYLWRAGLKEDSSLDNLEKEIQDLEKAIFHIKDEISRKRGE